MSEMPVLLVSYRMKLKSLQVRAINNDKHDNLGDGVIMQTVELGYAAQECLVGISLGHFELVNRIAYGTRMRLRRPQHANT